MWEQYLEIALSLTREFWPLLGTVMLVLVLPVMICRAGRNGQLAAKSVKELNARIEELQAALKNVKSGESAPETSDEVSEGDASDSDSSNVCSAEEELKEKEAEKVFEAFAKACQEKIAAEEAQAEAQEETVAQAREEVSFDGNLAVDQPDFSEPVAAPAPQPKAETKLAPAPVAAPPVETKKDRNVVKCNNCGNKLAYKSEWSGKRVKCPSCKEIIALP